MNVLSTDESTPTDTAQVGRLPVVRAWGCSVRFFAAAVLELPGLVRLLVAGTLTCVGAGLWLLPAALDEVSVNADRSRELARRLGGAAVDARRRPVHGVPGPARARHTWQRLGDPVVQRELLWQLLNPVVGMTLGILSVALVVQGLWELVALPFELAFEQFRPATWFAIADAWPLPPAVTIVLGVAGAGAQILAGVGLARPLVRVQTRWARRLLHSAPADRS